MTVSVARIRWLDLWRRLKASGEAERFFLPDNQSL
jgi:hypothetical protein